MAIDKVKKILYKKARRNGDSKTQSLREAGYKESTAKIKNTDRNNPLVKVSEVELIEELSSPETIKIYKKLLASKLKLEQQVYDNAFNNKKLKQDERLKIMNKSKDTIDTLTKTVRLLEGNSTENVIVDDQRQTRLTSMYDRLKQGAMN